MSYSAGKMTNIGPVAQCPLILGWAPNNNCLGVQLVREIRAVCKCMKSILTIAVLEVYKSSGLPIFFKIDGPK